MRAIAVLAVLVYAVPALADDEPSNVEAAKTLFDSGRKAVEERNWVAACALFEKSYQLDPAPGTRLNLAECRERDGKPRDAWLLWISSAEEFERADDSTSRARAKFARDHAEKLSDKLATVVVHVARPNLRGLTLEIGDRKVEPATTVIERVDGGQVTVKVRAPSREPFAATVDTEVGKRVVVEVPKLKRIEAGPDDDDPTPGSRAPMWTGLAFGSGVLALLAAGYTVHELGRKNDIQKCDIPESCGYASTEERDQDGRSAATKSTVAMWTSGILAGVTIGFAIKAVRARHAAAKSTAMVAPMVSPRVAGATVLLRW